MRVIRGRISSTSSRKGASRERRETRRHADTGVTKVLGIDPGLEGSFVLYGGNNFEQWKMPTRKIGKGKEIVFKDLHAIIHSILVSHGRMPVYLERAVAFGMGSTGAFNYGRGFAAVEIALSVLDFPVTYVEPTKWAKEMHEGISKDLKPKAKSLVAIERLFPDLVRHLPRNTKGKLLEGPVDALLIAGYGYRKQGSAPPVDIEIPDFY